jgi:hypothetical protein
MANKEETRPMRPLDDRYFGGPRTQAIDWDRRAFDANYYDRKEGMYDAGGRDFAERMRNLDGREFPQAFGEPNGGWPLERPWVQQTFHREPLTEEQSGFVENVKSFFGFSN